MNASTIRPAVLLLAFACAAVLAQPARRNAPAPVASEEQAASQPAAARLLDLNSATAAELARLPKMNDRLARKVVENRPYKEVRDLIDRGILPNNVYQAIKGRAEVNKS